MIHDLEELTRYVRQTVPQAKTITHLHPIEEANVVTFHWEGRDFAVRKSLEVFEMKGKLLYITGASMLMQFVLTNRTRNEKAIETIVSILKESQEKIESGHQSEAGLKLLELAKASLARLIGKSPAHPQNSLLDPSVKRGQL